MLCKENLNFQLQEVLTFIGRVRCIHCTEVLLITRDGREKEEKKNKNVGSITKLRGSVTLGARACVQVVGQEEKGKETQ